MISTVALTVLSLCLLGALIYRELAHDRERQGLLDRIQNPLAAQAAAATHMLPAPKPTPVPDPVYVPFNDPDLKLLQEL